VRVLSRWAADCAGAGAAGAWLREAVGAGCEGDAMLRRAWMNPLCSKSFTIASSSAQWGIFLQSSPNEMPFPTLNRICRCLGRKVWPRLKISSCPLTVRDNCIVMSMVASVVVVQVVSL